LVELHQPSVKLAPTKCQEKENRTKKQIPASRKVHASRTELLVLKLMRVTSSKRDANRSSSQFPSGHNLRIQPEITEWFAEN